jgi:hypothetical protein
LVSSFVEARSGRLVREAPPPDPLRVYVDLPHAIVGEITGTVLYEANARAVQIGAETDKSLFDAFA